MKRDYTYSLATLDQVVDHLDSLRTSCSIFTFTGTLGTGKTTLIKQLLARAGVTQLVTSPTFTTVMHYTNTKGESFYHFDLYRLGSLEEFDAAGFKEYLYQPNSWSYIEWPEVIEPLLRHQACHCFLEHCTEDTRRISLHLS